MDVMRKALSFCFLAAVAVAVSSSLAVGGRAALGVSPLVQVAHSVDVSR
jgi:hypothetical protein